MANFYQKYQETGSFFRQEASKLLKWIHAKDFSEQTLIGPSQGPSQSLTGSRLTQAVNEVRPLVNRTELWGIGEIRELRTFPIPFN